MLAFLAAKALFISAFPKYLRIKDFLVTIIAIALFLLKKHLLFYPDGRHNMLPERTRVYCSPFMAWQNKAGQSIDLPFHFPFYHVYSQA